MDAHPAILARLAPGETLLWSQAAPANELAAASIGLLAFMLLWNGVVWFVLIRGFISRGQEVHFDPGPWGKVFGAVIAGAFVLGGLLGLVATGENFLSSWSTTYALTDQRVIIATDFPLRRTDSYRRDAFTRMEVSAGEVRFDWGRAGKGGDNFRRQLRGVPDPQALARRIQDVLAPETAPVD